MKPILEPIPQRQLDRPLSPELELLARWMDSAFHIPGVGVRFGWDVILGLIPGLGDSATSLVSLYILTAANRYGIPRVTLLRMAANIGIDYVVGAIPILGDAFDVYWKANQRNVALLREHVLTNPALERRARKRDWLFLAGLIVLLVTLLVGAVTISWYLLAWIGGVLFQPRG